MTRVAAAIEVKDKVVSPRFLKAIKDVFLGIGLWRIWFMLGWQDIRLRYRRSHIGPFWITFSMALTVYTLSILYSHLWKISYHEYMLYFACGLLSWTFIVTIVTESTNVFSDAKGYLLQIQIPFSVFVMRMLVRNFIVFLHNFLAIIPLLVFYHTELNWHTLLIFPIIALIFLPAFTFSMLLAMVGLRYRDIGQFITNIMNLIFFFTPIMWLPTNLPQHLHFIIYYNPIAQLIELMRAPLMGQLPSEHAVVTMIMLFFVSLVLMLWCFSKVRHRIVFWL
ncbi:MAG: hypothetical protein A3F13_07465 [Gammaproteobacteria bacterium RIFCSPHIGHO2_12_FULL_40_19]|nr:MAG: hypothetical protein A3F13_07465 [Gammaproteobacteria bacterium RIFCSPHIGHO2_12_FULL_40_19]